MLRATLLQLGSPCPLLTLPLQLSLSLALSCTVSCCVMWRTRACSRALQMPWMTTRTPAVALSVRLSVCVSLCVRVCVSLCVVMRARKCVAALGATPTRTSSNCCPLLHCWAAPLALWGGPRLCSARLDSTRLAPRPNVKIIVKGN